MAIPLNENPRGLYVPTQRYGKPNIYKLRRVMGNGPELLEYQRWQDGHPSYYYGAENRSIRAYSFSGIKAKVAPILDPGAEEMLKAWEARVGPEEADRIRNEAINAGKIGHSMLEHWNEGKPLGAYPLHMGGYVQALTNNILPYLQQSNPPLAVVDDAGEVVTLSEVFVADFHQQFLGRLDLVVEIAVEPFAGQRVLLELKGSRKEKTLDHMRANIIQGVSYLTTFNRIASAFPDRILPLDGMAMAYMYRSGNGQVMPLFGEELQEYVEEWQQWLACFHDVIHGRMAA